jgi:hypothetical protein
VAGILVGALAASAVQAWPLWESAAASTRRLQDQPANVYQAWEVWRAGEAGADQRIAAGLWGPPRPGSQQAQALQFSQPPWQWSTLIAGNLLGTWRSQHARWDRHWLANDRIWNPTLYAGLITAVLVLASLGEVCRGLCRLRLGTGAAEAGSVGVAGQQGLVGVWLWGLLLVFGLASCGWYGPVWLWTELQVAAGFEVRTPTLGPQVGGMYSLLTWLIPGFDQFRYPAKLWLLASVAWSLLAARQLSRLSGTASESRGDSAERRRVQLSLAWVLLGLAVALGVCLSPSWIQYFFRTFQTAPPDPWLGQLQLPRALLEIHLTLLQALAVGGLFWAWLYWQPRLTDTRRTESWWLAVLSLLTVGDLWISNGWLVQTVDHRVLVDGTVWERPDSPYRANEHDMVASPAQRRFLYDPDLMQQHRWQQIQSKWGPSWAFQPPEKLAWQALYSLRATGAPQFHLATAAPSLAAELTLEPRGSGLLREWVLEQLPQLPEVAGRDLWHGYLRSQGVRHWLTWLPPQPPATAGPVLGWATLPGTPPPVWLAQDWQVRPLPRSLGWGERRRDLGLVWSEAEAGAIAILDCPDRVVVDQPVEFPARPGAGNAAAAGTATAVVQSEGDATSGLIDWTWNAEERSAAVRAAAPAVLVWRQQYDPGWWALVSHAGGPWQWQRPFPVQRYLTGVAIVPGQSQVRLIYWPTWWWLGGGLSLLAWACLLSLTRLSGPWSWRSARASQGERLSQSPAASTTP